MIIQFRQAPFLFLFIYFFAISQPVFSQALTNSDTQEIKLRAQQTVELFAILLNGISYELISSTQIEKSIQNSLSGDRQIFRDEQVRISYDLDPELPLDNRDVDVKTYLKDFNVFYKKSYDQTVNFSDFKVSDVYSGAQGAYYIKVQYVSDFTNAHKDKSTPYNPIKKIAELVVSRTISGWNLYIVNIRNYDSSNATVYRELDFTPEYINEQFTQAITQAIRYRSLYKYKVSMDYYQEAYTYKRLDSIEQRIMELNDIIDEKNDRSRFYNINDYSRELAQTDNNPNLYFERGLKYFDINSFTKAIVDFRNAIRIAPTYHMAYLYLAQSYDKNKQPNQAIEHYISAYELYPENEEFLPRLTNLILGSQQPARALPYLDVLIASDPTNEGYLYQRAELYIIVKDYDQALQAYQELLTKDPNNTEILLKLAEIEKQRGNLDQSREYLSKTGEISPSRSDEVIRDLYEESRQALAGGDTIQAELLLTQYLELSPDNAKGWIARAEIYEGLKEWENAIKDYTEAIQRYPNAELYLHRGMCYEKLSANENALDDYLEAQSQNPSLCESYRRSALIYESMQIPTEVATQLEAFLSCGQGSLPNYLELIEYYFSNEDYDKAEEIIKQAQKQFNNESAIYCWMSKIQVLNKEYYNAEYSLKDAIKYDDQNAEAYYLMYQLQRDFINPKKADKYYQTAVQIDPSYKEQ